MPRIDTGPGLAALLAQHAATLRRTGAGSGTSAPRGPVQEPADAAALAAERIRALHPDDPQRRHKALRIVLETVLLQQFGAAVANDSSFPGLVDAVQRDLQADRRLAEAAGTLTDLLLTTAR